MRLDKAIAFLVLVASSLLLIVSILNQGKGIGITVVLLASSLIYLKFEGAMIDRREPIYKPTIQGLLYTQISVLITVLIGIFLIFSLSLPLRGFWFFVSSSILAAIVTLEILFLRKFSGFITANILLQIILIATILRWSLIFESITYVARDQWYHTYIADAITKQGRLNVVSPSYDTSGYVEHYRSFPVYHILISIFKIVTGISLMKDAITYSIGISDLVGLTILFLLYIQILGQSRIALLATLLTATANWNIIYGVWLIPQSLGLVFFSIMSYLCFSSAKYGRLKLLLASMFSFVLILSHTLSAFVWAIFALTVVLGGLVHRKLYKKFQRPVLLLEAFIIFSVALISYWQFASNVFVDYTQSVYTDILASRGVLGLTPLTKSIVIYELDNIGVNLFFLPAIVGSLAWLHKKNLNFVRFLVVASFTSLFLIIYTSMFFGIAYGSSFESERWYCFLFLLAAMPAAYIIDKLSKARSRFVGGTLAILIVSTLVLTMSGNSIASFDVPLVGSRYAVDPRFLNSETNVADFVNATFKGTVATDGIFDQYFKWQLNRDAMRLEFMRPDNIYINASYSHVITIIRNHIYYRPVPAVAILSRRRPFIIVEPSFERKLDRLNRIISTGTTTAYQGLISSQLKR